MSDRIVTLYPIPRVMERLEGSYSLGATLSLTVPDEWRAPLAADLEALAGRLASMPEGATTLRVAQGAVPEANDGQGYALSVTPQGISLVAAEVDGARHGMRSLRRLASRSEIGCAAIQDSPTFARRGVQIDLGRVIERPETVKRLLPLYADLRYNVLQLYLENAFLFPSHPKLARPWAWTLEQAKDVVEEAGRWGITVIPALQSLGHCHWVGSHPEYAELDETHEAGRASGVLCPSHPRTLEMLEGMVRDVAPLATAGIIHMGLDEVFAIGRCSRCAPRRAEIGEGGIFAEHANRVAGMVRAAGRRPGMWGDMFYYHPDRVADLAKDILIFDWYYYAFERTPRVELFGFPEMDTQALWKRHGLESWGCPASVYTAMMPLCLPDESIENARSWARYLKEHGAQGVMVTQWELSPTSVDFCPPVEAAMAAFLWGSSEEESADLLTQGCSALYDRPALAGHLEEIGERRLRGHCALRWLRAPSLAEMVTYTGTEEDLGIAERLEDVGREIIAQAKGARYSEMVAAFAPAARWLAYQYRKRFLVDEAARCAVAGDPTGASARLSRLRDDALALAEAWQEQWNRNRFPEDTAPLPTRLRDEAAMYEREVAAQEAAAAGAPKARELARAVVGVHVVNTHPAIPIFRVETSADGVAFTERARGTILAFDSRAAQPASDEEWAYTFAVDAPADARFVRVTALGDGQFTLRGVSVHRGGQQWAMRSVRAEGRVHDADALLSGGLARLGHPDPQALYQGLLAEGDSSRIFSVEHGALTVEMAPA